MGTPRIIAIAVLCVLVAAGRVHAWQTMNAVKSAGEVVMGIHKEDARGIDHERALGFAEFLGVAPRLVAMDDYPALLQALEDGSIDLIVNPVDRARPVPASLAFTAPVEFVDLAVLGSRSAPPLVVFGSDEWYRMVEVRASGSSFPVAIAGRETSRGMLRRRLSDEDQPILSFVHEAENATAHRSLAQGIPLSWLVRSDDRVLTFKVDRYLHSHALVEDARRVGARLDASMVRARLTTGALTPYDDLSRHYARYFGFDWRLVLAIMHQESRFDPSAESKSGAKGLMQLMDVAIEQVGMHTPQNAAENVLAGVRYLDWVRDQFEADLDIRERIWFSLASYNAGLSHILRARERARTMGLDPNRWQNHVEQAYVAYAIDAGIPAAKRREVVQYVSSVRRQFAVYVRITEGPDGFQPLYSSSKAAIAAAP